MRSATLWTIAASLAALALLALADSTDNIKMDLLKKMSSCCRTTKKLLAVFHSGGITCGGLFAFDKLSSYVNWADTDQLAPQLQDGCLVDCIYEQNHYLKLDKSIDHEKLKRDFLKEIEGRPQDVKPVVETAIDKCFKLVEENEGKIQNAQNKEAEKLGRPPSKCRQAPQLVLTCIAGFTLLNCPKSDWKDDKDKCSGKREALKQDILTLTRMQIAQMQKNDPTIEFTPEQYSKMGFVRPKGLRVKTGDEHNKQP